jgi:hypothetical protein
MAIYRGGYTVEAPYYVGTFDTQDYSLLSKSFVWPQSNNLPLKTNGGCIVLGADIKIYDVAGTLLYTKTATNFDQVSPAFDCDAWAGPGYFDPATNIYHVLCVDQDADTVLYSKVNVTTGAITVPNTTPTAIGADITSATTTFSKSACFCYMSDATTLIFFTIGTGYKFAVNTSTGAVTVTLNTNVIPAGKALFTLITDVGIKFSFDSRYGAITYAAKVSDFMNASIALSFFPFSDWLVDAGVTRYHLPLTKTTMYANLNSVLLKAGAPYTMWEI